MLSMNISFSKNIDTFNFSFLTSWTMLHINGQADILPLLPLGEKKVHFLIMKYEIALGLSQLPFISFTRLRKIYFI